MGCCFSTSTGTSAPLVGHETPSNLNLTVDRTSVAPENSTAAPIITADSEVPTVPISGQFIDGVLVSSPGKLEDHYIVEEVLGEGGYAVVHKGKNRETGTLVAIKRQSYQRTGLASVLDEIRILHSLSNTHIVRVYEFFDVPEKQQCNIVMEYLDGGELFDRIISIGSGMTEADARDLVIGLLKALRYMHSKSVLHRDLKPENLLMLSPESNNVKIADFGLAVRYKKDSPLKQCVGTIGYQAPELLMRKPYDRSVDMFSFGVILYIILSGTMPFYNPRDDIINSMIVSGELHFPDDVWANVSSSARDLVKKLLCNDPKVRLSAEQALIHPWCTASPELLSKHKVDVDRLRSFQARRKFKGGVKAVMANNMFKKFITSKSGSTEDTNIEMQTMDEQLPAEEIQAAEETRPVEVA